MNLALRFRDQLSKIPYLVDELEGILAGVIGSWSVEHNAQTDGHGDVTATSMKVTGNLSAAAGTFTGNVIGDSDGEVVTIGQVVEDGASGAGIDMSHNAASHWSIAADQGLFSAAPALVFTDRTNQNAAASVCALYRPSAVNDLPAIYSLVPTHQEVSLKLGENSIGHRLAEVNSLVYNGGESGVWTPVLTFGGAGTGITYSLQSGTYSRFGKTVTLEMRLVLTSKGTATGAAEISGLPYSANLFPPGLLDFGAGGVSLGSTPYCAAAGPNLFPLHIVSGVRTQLSNANFSGTDDVRLAMTFQIP